MSFIPLGILAASGAGGGGSFESIATITAGVADATVSFTSIPSTYKHLQIRYSVNEGTGGGITNAYIRFNGVTSGYATHRLEGNGSSAAAAGSASSSTMFGGYYAGTANNYGAAIIDIHDYASTTKNKTMRIFNGVDLNGSGYVALTSGLYASTSAVTTILIGAGGLFTSGSVFSLYGIKGD
jgi:hypothetical protein